jgi:hypothetical protein
MSRCPFCGARGVKLRDELTLNGVGFRFDYCGRCGKNWPEALSAEVEADANPPQEDIPTSRGDASPKVVPFGAKVADMADRIKAVGRDWKFDQAGESR